MTPSRSFDPGRPDPAIAITGMPDRAGTGFLAVVSKPIEIDHLNQLISGATRRRPAGSVSEVRTSAEPHARLVM